MNYGRLKNKTIEFAMNKRTPDFVLSGVCFALWMLFKMLNIAFRSSWLR